ncbi:MULTISPECIES: polysaccharide pyruvyl transferase family protein [unclassified Pseudoalteromonas]|uniref:polysaccharide pyruvyl transferase family protein n=2 Tax=Pseudoalteromonas TaxID=53246 RepID=UPI000422BAB7|nr:MULTISPECIES: polysaccharide pyruvyl transferase family protein [unclassified Pseudoalteromonas]
MTKATIFGYHGMKNYGDDFFLDYITSFCNVNKIEECFLTSRRGSLTILQKAKYHLEINEFLPNKNLIRGYDKWFLLFLYALKSDYLIFCAGSIFTILPERLFLNIIKLLKFIKPKLKIVAIGVSIGPFKDEIKGRHVLDGLELFDLVLVRDQKSLLFRKLKNVQFINDLAFTHRPNFKVKSSGLGIALNPYISVLDRSKIDFEFKRNDLLVDCILQSKNNLWGPIKIFITCDDKLYGDNQISFDLQKKLESQNFEVEVIKYDGDISYFESELAHVEKLISSRLHSGFFGLLNGAQVFQLKYAEKIFEFYKGLSLESITFHEAYDFNSKDLDDFLSTPYKHSAADFEKLTELSCTVSEKYNNALSDLFL